MKVGIFGELFSGKSTLLRVLMKEFGHEFDQEKGKQELFVATIPDEKVDYLARVYNPKRKVYPTMTFQEIPSGAEGVVDAKNTPSIGSCDLLLLMIPLFQSGPRGGGSAGSGAYDFFLEVDTELCLADYMVIQKRLERLVKEGKKSRELHLMEKVVSTLESSIPLRDTELDPNEKTMLSGFSLVSGIPVVVVMNVDEKDIRGETVKGDAEKFKGRGIESMVICAGLEEEIMGLDPGDRNLFMREAGMEGFFHDALLEVSFRLLHVITFLTVNPNEVRAWNIRDGTSAIEAAGKIHSDMERGFIRAEVISFDDFSGFDDMAAARSAGKVRLEGKEYVIGDGEIVTIRFNV